MIEWMTETTTTVKGTVYSVEYAVVDGALLTRIPLDAETLQSVANGEKDAPVNSITAKRLEKGQLHTTCFAYHPQIQLNALSEKLGYAISVSATACVRPLKTAKITAVSKEAPTKDAVIAAQLARRKARGFSDL